MAKAKKAVRSTKPAGVKPISDVAHPGTLPPSDTSKSIITPRPIMKDPMVVEDGEKPADDKAALPARKTGELNVEPPASVSEDAPAAPDSEESEPEKPSEPKTETPKPDDQPAEEKPEEKNKKSPPESGPNAEAEADAKEAKLQQLIDSKKYALPINAVEQRRSKQVVTLGIILALLLAAAWVDIALDAGIIEINGVKPLTHFFSN